MKLLAASTITFIDQNDTCLAMLTSEVLLVPCDSQGMPKLPLGSSPLTSRMSILQGGVEQSGWTFTRTQQGVTSSVDASGLISVTGISSDNGHVEVTATKAGHEGLTKKMVVSKVYQGETGDMATDFSIELSPRAFLVSSRGMVLESQVITAVCRKMNVVGTALVGWEAPGVQLSETTGEVVTITIPSQLMLTSFLLSCSLVGYGTKGVEVQGIPSGQAKPMYLGLLPSAPATTPEGPLAYSSEYGGDYYLGTDMIPYWYNGFAFTSEGLGNVPNYADIMSHCAADALKVSTPIPVTSAIFAYFENLAATDAYIGKLRTRRIRLLDEGTIESEHFVSGQKGFQMKADGSFEAVDAVFRGTGTFEGKMVNTVFETQEATPNAAIDITTPSTHWKQSEIVIPYQAKGLYNGKAFKQIGQTVNKRALIDTQSRSWQSEVTNAPVYTVPLGGLTYEYKASGLKSYYYYGGYSTLKETKLWFYMDGSQIAYVEAINAPQTYNNSETIVATGTLTPSEGTVFTATVMDHTSGSKPSAGIELKIYKELGADGTYIWYEDDTFDLIPKDSYQTGNLIVNTSAGTLHWDSTANTRYRPAIALMSGMTNLPIGREIFVSTAEGISRSLTIETETFTDVVSITVNLGSLVIRMPSEYRTVIKQEYYTALVLSVIPLSEQPAVLTDSLIPIRALPDIGEEGNRYGNFWVTNIRALEVNSQETANNGTVRVWGAVAN